MEGFDETSPEASSAGDGSDESMLRPSVVQLSSTTATKKRSYGNNSDVPDSPAFFNG